MPEDILPVTIDERWLAEDSRETWPLQVTVRCLAALRALDSPSERRQDFLQVVAISPAQADSQN
jgi:hypothetical protein